MLELSKWETTQIAGGTYSQYALPVTSWSIAIGAVVSLAMYNIQAGIPGRVSPWHDVLVKLNKQREECLANLRKSENLV